MQIALMNLEARLTALERQKPPVAPGDLATLKSDLLKAITAATGESSIPNPLKAFRPGSSAHAPGIVPDPGLPLPAGLFDQYLREDAKWVYTLAGLLLLANFPSLGAASQVDVDTQKVNLLADLAILGQLSAGNILCNDLTYMGTLTPKPLRTVGYLCSGSNATLDTLIFNDDTSLYTLVSGKVQVNTPGLYLVIGGVSNSGGASGGPITSSITKNGSAVSSFVGTFNSSGTFSPVWPVALNLVAGDQLGVFNPDAAGSFIYAIFLHP